MLTFAPLRGEVVESDEVGRSGARDAQEHVPFDSESPHHEIPSLTVLEDMRRQPRDAP
jgi:hypothetical protein